MSKIFYDHLIVFEELETHIKRVAKTCEEREELWQLIDEMVHHKVLNIIFEFLPEEDHYEFLEKFHLCPYDQGLVDFVNTRIEKNIEEVIKEELERFEQELLQEISKTP